MTNADAIAQRLTAALKAVEQAEVPSDLRDVAFAHALDLLNTSSGEPTGRNYSALSSGGEENGLLVEIAERVGVDFQVVSGIFEQKDDQIHLVVGRAQLPNRDSRAASMRDVALLVVTGRQGAGLEDYTPTSLIRRECEEIGVLDSSNFSVEVARLGMRARGGPKSREVHASRHQLEVAGELMVRITGGEGP